jgi:hypothetical protein
MESNIASMNVLLYFTAFILGYIVGRITGKPDISDHRIDAKGSFFKPEIRQRKQVEIDEKKFVTSVSTDSLERKGKDLGTQTTVEDDLTTSASKLAMLKKNK